MRNVFAVVPLSLLALAGCRAPLDEEPPVDRETGELSFDHPDFLAKLRDPAGYAGPSRRRGYQPWSICGFSTDFQDVNRYDGTLGVTTRYVWKHEHAVGELQTPEGDAYCSGTSVGDGLFLTASHCVGSAITGDALVLNDEVPFRTGEPWLKVRRHGITVVEDGAGFGVDYALLRIPGLTTRRVAAADPGLGSQVTIIQHPDGMPKQTESGVIAGFTGNFIKYSGLDTLPGSSGSGILDDSGLLVGVHTNGDCGLLGGTNAGMRISAILPVSPVLSALVAGPQPDPAAGDVHVGVSDTTRFLDRGFAQHGDTCGTGAGTCAIGDVDGDGQADLVHFVQDAFGAARVTPARPWSNSAASHFKAPVTGRQEVCRPNRTCRLGDVDGDGRADAVEFANDGAP
jgi:V8-like Glu-specific endopeptidase